MRHGLPAVLLLVLAACGTPTPTSTQDPPAEAPDAVLMKLRDGEAPANLGYDKNQIWLSEISTALAENRAWNTDADALAAVAYFARHAGQDELPVLEKLLTSDRPDLKMRGLFIVRMSKFEGTIEPLNRHAATLLNPEDTTVARVALGAMGQRRARESTEAILDYFKATEDDAAIRALGRIWEGGGEGPLRTASLIVAHAEGMGAESSETTAGALLRMMTDPELDEFLAKWVPEKFASRAHVVAAAGEKGFDARRGAKIHEAFLKSPDPDIVMTILWRTPHRLKAESVRPLLADESVSESGARVCDYAAARLESIESGLPLELPADEAQRERRLKKWRAKAN